jgi:hypothetical protein
MPKVFIYKESLKISHYIFQYERCLEILIKANDKSSTDFDIIAFPLFYIIRHILELKLKYAISYFQPHLPKFFVQDEELTKLNQEIKKV